MRSPIYRTTFSSFGSRYSSAGTAMQCTRADRLAGIRRYGAAKLCQVMMLRLEKDSKLSSISVLAVDPAAMPTELSHRDGWVRGVFLAQVVLRIVAAIIILFRPNDPFRTTWKSVGDVLYAVFETETLGSHPSGIYMNGSKRAKAGAESEDLRMREQLWCDSLGYVRATEGDTVLTEWR
ncbi:hypothetical protein MGYG_09029 [Nannizzia gypsea CBS 118893]|uniref:Short-chain dehydrogenase/reductase SDR n=1 Tax=Arthroderma gypseum (strain ATCC MYA-4604 / CBS 118893) TaxID=535722 RepID=E4UU42_ARTGP|nr:hypothetical protein MGYG_09029 [Nannizzia gypsea CBS 118893]EFR00809.1 hypothetical protein MGYG_09029 [Nannizzia gypsea CBS 118893]